MKTNKENALMNVIHTYVVTFLLSLAYSADTVLHSNLAGVIVVIVSTLTMVFILTSVNQRNDLEKNYAGLVLVLVGTALYAIKFFLFIPLYIMLLPFLTVSLVLSMTTLIKLEKHS